MFGSNAKAPFDSPSPLDRPERRNAITVANVRRTRRCDFRERSRRSARRSGHHRSRRRAGFCRGQRPCRLPGSRAPRLDEEIPVWRLLRALATCETPIVAAVHGNCVGIGTDRCCACTATS